MSDAVMERPADAGSRERLDRLASDPDRLWTYAEFGAWAGVGERTARAWANSEGGPPVVALGRHRRIRVGDALVWLQTRYVARRSA